MRKFLVILLMVLTLVAFAKFKIGVAIPAGLAC